MSSRNTHGAQQFSWVPALMLLTLALFTIKLLDPTPWLACTSSVTSTAETHSHSPHHAHISSSMFNVNSLSLFAGRSFLRTFPSDSSRPGCTNVSMLLLVLCGDIQVNPGPVANPCMGCSQPVAKNHRHMECENCHRKIHIKCGNVTPKNYSLFKLGLDPYPWRCPICDPMDAAGNATDNSFSSNSADSEHSNSSTDDSTNGQTDSSSSYKRVDMNKLKTLVINCRSVFSKAKGAALKAKIVDSKPDIVIANESELTKDRVDSDFLPPGYQSIRLDKSANRHGVFIAFRNELVVTPVALKHPDKTLEFVLAKLEVIGKPDLYIGSFYRPTNADPSSLKSLYDNLVEITGGRKLPNMILAGDFNLPDADWESGTYNSSPQYGKDVNEKGLEFMSNLFLTQMVSESTRGRNTLDLLFATCPDLVEDVRVQPGISDHDAV